MRLKPFLKCGVSPASARALVVFFRVPLAAALSLSEISASVSAKSSSSADLLTLVRAPSGARIPNPSKPMKRIYTATIRYANRDVRIERRFPSHSLCRRYMAEYAGKLQFLHGYRVLGVSRLGDFLASITLSDGTDHVVISFSREA